MSYTDLNLVRIHNHPTMVNSKIHLKMIKKILEIVDEEKFNQKLNKYKNPSSKLKYHIFLGNTSMILNSINTKNLNILQIFGDSLLENYDRVLWPSIKFKLIDSNIATYNKVS